MSDWLWQEFSLAPQRPEAWHPKACKPDGESVSHEKI